MTAMIHPTTLERLDELDLPPGVHHAVIGDAPEALEIVLWTDPTYYRCPSCAVPVARELQFSRELLCACGHDLTPPWCTVRAAHEDADVWPADVLTAADALHGQYRGVLYVRRSQLRGQLRRELAEARTTGRLSTAPPELPGVHQLLPDGLWSAWDFDPDGSGDAVRVTEDRDMSGSRRRTHMEQLQSRHGLTIFAASAYLHAAKGDLELAGIYARLGPCNPLVANAICNNPPRHLRYRVLTGVPPVDLMPGQVFTHLDVRITPALAQTLLDRYTRSPAQRPLSNRWVYIIEESLQDPDDGLRFETITVACDGTTIAGKHLLHAVVSTGITAVANVEHNVPMPERLATSC